MEITREDLLQMTESMRELYGAGFQRGKIFTMWSIIEVLEKQRFLCTSEEPCNLNIEYGDWCYCDELRAKLEDKNIVKFGI